MVEPRDSHRDPPTFQDPEHPERHAPDADADADGDGGGTLASAVSVNAMFSAGSGLVLLAGAPILAGWFEVDGWLLAGIGGGLVVFAGVLVWLLADPPRLAVGAWWVLGVDGTSPITLRVERTIAASTARVWDAVSDAGLRPLRSRYRHHPHRRRTGRGHGAPLP